MIFTIVRNLKIVFSISNTIQQKYTQLEICTTVTQGVEQTQIRKGSTFRYIGIVKKPGAL